MKCPYYDKECYYWVKKIDECLYDFGCIFSEYEKPQQPIDHKLTGHIEEGEEE